MSHIQMVNRPVVIARGVLSPSSGDPEQAAPGNGSTITIYDSTLNHNGVGKQKTGIPFTRLLLSIDSSANSAASGVVVNSSEDGVNFDAETTFSYLTANGITHYDLKVQAPHYQITYQNSAAVLTVWRMSLTGILGDRAPGT